MKGICAISDIHIRPTKNLEKQVFIEFINHPMVQNAQTIVFLGDIFDVWVGSYPEYLRQYPFFFEHISKMLSAGKQVHYIEGNHDLHMQSLFCQAFGKGPFHYYKGGFLKQYGDKKIYFSHGDDLDFSNSFYTFYRQVLASNFTRLLTEFILPYSFVERIGHNASKASRRRNQTKYSLNKNDKVKQKFRDCADRAHQLFGFDLLVCGHSHIKDFYHSKKGFTYINNGYAPLEKTFIHIDETVSFLEL